MNFFHSKLGGPTDGQALGEKNKLWEGPGILWNPFPSIQRGIAGYPNNNPIFNVFTFQQKTVQKASFKPSSAITAPLVTSAVQY
jgi:hypothetical protein